LEETACIKEAGAILTTVSGRLKTHRLAPKAVQRSSTGIVPPELLVVAQFIVCGLCFLLTDCSTVDSTSATSFASAATATGQQADIAFAQVNALTSESIIENAAQQSTLSPANFYKVVPTEDITAWDKAFSAMAAYAHSLNTLSSSANSESTATAVGGLATTIESQTKSNSLSGISAAFIAVAGALEKAKFGHDACEVAVAADPDIQKITQAMADAIGGSHKEGLRGTVWANYQSYVMAPLQVKFLSATDADKQSLAKQFSTALDQRAAADLQLQSLQASILALKDAHHAIVTKSSVGFAAALTNINQQLSTAQETYSEVKGASTGK
jgi:hypothetical protein